MEELINYVTESPENTNPNVVRSLVSELISNNIDNSGTTPLPLDDYPKLDISMAIENPSYNGSTMSQITVYPTIVSMYDDNAPYIGPGILTSTHITDGFIFTSDEPFPVLIGNNFISIWFNVLDDRWMPENYRVYVNGDLTLDGSGYGGYGFLTRPDSRWFVITLKRKTFRKDTTYSVQVVIKTEEVPAEL